MESATVTVPLPLKPFIEPEAVGAYYIGMWPGNESLDISLQYLWGTKVSTPHLLFYSSKSNSSYINTNFCPLKVKTVRFKISDIPQHQGYLTNSNWEKLQPLENTARDDATKNMSLARHVFFPTLRSIAEARRWAESLCLVAGIPILGTQKVAGAHGKTPLDSTESSDDVL